MTEEEICSAEDPITGAVCNKPPEAFGPHLVHKCTDEGIEFTWKADPADFVNEQGQEKDSE